jgi:hypothetical protein
MTEPSSGSDDAHFVQQSDFEKIACAMLTQLLQAFSNSARKAISSFSIPLQKQKPQSPFDLRHR